MEQKQIDRINELAKKAKSPEGLTEWEEMERAALRPGIHRLRIGQPERAAGKYLYCGCQGQQNKAEEKG